MADRRKKSVLAAWFLGGSIVSLVVAFLAYRNWDEPLTQDALRSAQARWETSGPKSYTLEVDVDGDLHTIEVSNGKVVNMMVWAAKAPENVWSHWSIEGMFGFLQAELENGANPQKAYGVSDPSQVVLRVNFDAEWGYPKRFFRHVIGHGAGIQWEVRRLTPEQKSYIGWE